LPTTVGERDRREHEQSVVPAATDSEVCALNKTRCHTAFHEAGHVVANWALGFACLVASIVEEEGMEGHVVEYRYYEGAHEERGLARDSIITFYAGMEAQLRFDPDYTEGSEYDDRLAVELSRDYSIPLGGLRQRARRIIWLNWPAVESVARELLKRETMNANELRQLAATIEVA
jgi:ATP-dependent Zn protease